MTDSERLDWYQAQHTLHKSLEVLYVVDGYELSVMAEDGERVVATYRGETLRDAIDQAIRSTQPKAEAPTPSSRTGSLEWLREWAQEEARDE